MEFGLWRQAIQPANRLAKRRLSVLRAGRFGSRPNNTRFSPRSALSLVMALIRRLGMVLEDL